MKKLTTLILLLLCVATLFAQAPEKFSYQAVVRNASNALVSNTQVGVRVNILQGSATGNAVYSESHVVTTNANGLLSVNIGGGSVLHGSFAGIDWSDGPYFLKTDIDPNGGNDYSITSTQQLLSVPYALYAIEAANGFSGDYNDLTNTPTIPTVPTDVSAFNNDAGYITASEVPAQVNADWNATTGAAEILNKPTIPSVPTNVSAFTNDAGYITSADIPAVPTVPTNVSDLTNDAGYITSYTETDPQFNAWNKDYNDLINKPVIPTVPTNVSSFNNDAGYITSAQVPAQVNADWNAINGAAEILNKPTIPTVPSNVSSFTNDAGYITAAQVPAQVNADWNATTGVAKILNKPTIPTVPENVSSFNNDAGYITAAEVPAQMNADWNATTGVAKILNKPTIPTVPENVSSFNNDAGYITAAQVPAQMNADWNAITGAAQILNKPNLATVALSGNYNDLTNKPSIPTAMGDLINNVGYITASQVPAQVNADWSASSGAAQILNKPNLATVATTGNYSDLTNKPVIPTVPTSVSAFTNDAGYITSADVQQAAGVPTQVSAFQNDAGYITLAQVPTQVNADWNATTGAAKILNKPAIPTIPTNISSFNNDAGYLTSYTETDPQFTAWGKNYNTLVNKPNLATVATTGNYYDLSNTPMLFSGNYNDLSNKPTIPAAANNAMLTIQRNYSTVGTFTADASANKTINIAVPTMTSELTNNSGFITETQLNALLAAMNNTIDSLRDRIEELENGGTPVNPNPSIPDTTIPVIPIIVDGQACPGRETIYDIDGNPYSTVVIGQQCWMKTNLRTTHYSDGTAITLNGSLSNSSAIPRRYYPGWEANNLSRYGYLYNWYAVMNGNASSTANPSMVQGVCPVGWHVPSNVEWSQLRNYVNSYAGFRCSSTNDYIAKALCSPEYWNSTANSPCAVGYTPYANNNATGFSALPAGTISSNVDYNVAKCAYFWSCTQSNSSTAYYIQMNYNSPTVGVEADGYMNSFCSVRCVCDSAVSGGGAQAVVTGFVNNVTSTTAQCSGSVVTDNGYSVTERGVCWSTSNPPMVYHNRTIDGAGMGSFVSSLTNLIPGTTYYVRAYAITNAGTIYGGVVNFTTPALCGTSTVKDYDQIEYHTIQIGNQCWMKENLRSTHYADGTAISSASNVSSYTTYYYSAPSGSINKGYLYNWYAVMRSSSTSSAAPSGVQGICPTGWHVPSDAEWAVLENYVSSQDSCLCSSNSDYIAKALADNSGWHTNTGVCVVGNGQNNNNKTGFSAVPVGYFVFNTNYSGHGNNNSIGTNAYFWSATQSSTDQAWCRNLQYNNANVSRDYFHKGNGLSVRCIRD